MATNKLTYYDPETMSVGSITTTDNETWFNSADGVVSRVVEQPESLIPFAAYSAFVKMMQRAAQNSGNDTAIMPQYSDIVAAASGQCSDSLPTTTRQGNDTSAARNAKRPPLKPRQILKKYAAVVAILKDAKIIKEVSGGVYSGYKNLPTNTPQYLVDEINRRGLRRENGKLWTQETISPIVAAMKINARPTLFRVCFLIVVSIVIAVGVTKVWQWFAASTETTMQTEQSNNQNKFTAADVDLICKENKIKLTEYRVNLIVAKTYPDKAALAEEIKKQYAEMQSVIQKSK